VDVRDRGWKRDNVHCEFKEEKTEFNLGVLIINTLIYLFFYFELSIIMCAQLHRLIFQTV